MTIKYGIWAFTILSFVVTPLLGQTPQKLAAINKRVIGKWITADRKSYIEFAADGSCSTGELGNNGQWHVDHDTLTAPWSQSDDFMCGSGALELIGPNTLTRDYGMGGGPEKFYRGDGNPPSLPGRLTVATAQRVLARQINQPTVHNSLFTCRACYDPTDKSDNEQAPLVSTYSPQLTDYLIRQGYLRLSGTQIFFTGKAKQSRYYTAAAEGLQIANLVNPRILVSAISDPKHVPIEFDLVPTEITASFFGRVQRVKSFARFTYENEAWRMCLACQSQ